MKEIDPERNKPRAAQNDRSEESYITIDNMRYHYVDRLYARNRYQTQNGPWTDRAYAAIDNMSDHNVELLYA